MAKVSPHLKIVTGKARRVVCPLCKQLAQVPYTPFCSSRCAQLDLAKWLTGDYATPAYEAMDDNDVEKLLAAHEIKQPTQADEDT